jgi:hypothetical protein
MASQYTNDSRITVAIFDARVKAVHFFCSPLLHDSLFFLDLTLRPSDSDQLQLLSATIYSSPFLVIYNLL